MGMTESGNENGSSVRFLRVIFYFTFIFSIVELFSGIAANSLLLIEESIHMFADSMAFAVNLWAELRIAKSFSDNSIGPSRQHLRQKQKAQFIGTAVSFVTLFATFLIVLVEGIKRLLREGKEDEFIQVNPKIMMGFGVTLSCFHLSCLFAYFCGINILHAHSHAGSDDHEHDDHEAHNHAHSLVNKKKNPNLRERKKASDVMPSPSHDKCHVHVDVHSRTDSDDEAELGKHYHYSDDHEHDNDGHCLFFNQDIGASELEMVALCHCSEHSPLVHPADMDAEFGKEKELGECKSGISSMHGHSHDISPHGHSHNHDMVHDHGHSHNALGEMMEYHEDILSEDESLKNANLKSAMMHVFVDFLHSSLVIIAATLVLFLKDDQQNLSARIDAIASLILCAVILWGCGVLLKSLYRQGKYYYQTRNSYKLSSPSGNLLVEGHNNDIEIKGIQDHHFGDKNLNHGHSHETFGHGHEERVTLN